MSTPVLSATTLVQVARDALADARRLIRAAERAQACAASTAWLAEARAIITSARKLYASAMGKLASAGHLSHHYVAAPNGRMRAVVRIDGRTDRMAWQSPRTYGRRQSAQNAARRYVCRARMRAVVERIGGAA